MNGWRKAGVLVCGLCLAASLALAGEEAKAEEGVTVLFDGKGLDAWTQKAQGGWTVDDEGCLAWQKGCGYIWTKEQFGNFVLDLDFKVSPGCNSGIFIRTAKTGDPVQTGIEIQVLDSHTREKPGKNDCCSVYDCLAPSKNAEKKPGEWNHVAITCNDNKIEIVLNGEKVIDMDLDQWTEARKNPDGSGNKFKTAYKDMPRKGHIGFQDHGKAVWYRNIKIKELPEKKSL
ncbi:MAG TPA: DUF1080 domain-containing protein [Planctomycetota bacterium]|nr:DUF1080 domain-containing protein [Planctomycetota bacterium]